MLNKLEELNRSKFNFSEFISFNKEFQFTIENIVKNKKELNTKDCTTEDKNIILDLISKIDLLEAKILPKADLIKSFGQSRI